MIIKTEIATKSMTTKNEIELPRECKTQLEYLSEKHGETGTTNTLPAKLDKALFVNENRFCSIGKSYGNCQLHSENINGCLGCNHYE